MEQIKCYGDQRNKGFCVHCGGLYETDDHVPSKVLLDEPYPENLIVCPSCLSCNNLLSKDEAYVACLLECVLAGDADPARLHRPKIARLLEGNPALLKRLQTARSQGTSEPIWSIESDRVRTIVLKLARGHAAYEYNEPRLEAPAHIEFKPLISMQEPEREVFEGSSDAGMASWPEVGTRAMGRLLVVGSRVFDEGWIVVQEGNYRFRVSQEDGLTVKIVLREYLACRVVWE